MIEVGSTWVAVASKDAIAMPTARDTKIGLRAEQKAAVYAAFEEDFSDEQLVGVFEGETLIRCRRGDPPLLRVVTEGRVWAQYHAIDQQSYRQSDEVFTTLDRPPALSPEMRAVMELVRRNEIERDHIRSEINQLRELRNDRRTQETLDEEETASAGDEAKAEKPSRGRAKPKKPGAGKADETIPHADVLGADTGGDGPDPKSDKHSKADDG